MSFARHCSRICLQRYFTAKTGPFTPHSTLGQFRRRFDLNRISHHLRVATSTFQLQQRLFSTTPATPHQQTTNHPTTAPITNQPPSTNTTQVNELHTATTATPIPPPPPPPEPTPIFLRMPDIENVGKCRLLRWCIPVGTAYERGQVLCEIDSDLAVIEYKAQSDGILALIRTQAGERIVEDQVLGIQVTRPEDVQNADRWMAYVKANELKEKAELEAQEAKEEEELKKELSREQQQDNNAQ